MQLTERCDIWRMLGTHDGGKQMGAAYTRIPCLRVPISTFDQISSALSAPTGSIQPDRGQFPSPPSEYFHPQARQHGSDKSIRRLHFPGKSGGAAGEQPLPFFIFIHVHFCSSNLAII